MQVSIRELKANPARAIALMQQGERVQITSHRTVVAELVQPQTSLGSASTMTDEEAMQKLLASGLVAEPATKPFKLGKAIAFPPAPDGKTMSDWVIELRGPK
jgi:antitoxin (DNA-binding transcriptional repressor) of toxin-antitoxin stability system